MKTNRILSVALCALALASCTKELDLVHKYDNSSSSIVPEKEAWEDWKVEKNFDNFSLSEKTILDGTGMEFAGYWPDGKICSIKFGEDSFVNFWGEATSYRTIAPKPYLENHISQVKPENKVFGKGINSVKDFNEDGSWFIGVIPLEDGRIAGFFHAESHWSKGDGAYKSIGVAYSSDNGATWSKEERILSADTPKPAQAAWCGLGDGCVVYNPTLKAFICYYSGNDGTNYRICMAKSTDPAGAAGTWKKWDGKDFTIEGCNPSTGLGGKDVSIESLRGVSGANPSVMWNTYLKKWVMVYNTWNESVVLTTSADGLTWDAPIEVVGTTTLSETGRYPNLISDKGDTEGGQKVQLYYASNQGSNGKREIAHRVIKFK